MYDRVYGKKVAEITIIGDGNLVNAPKYREFLRTQNEYMLHQSAFWNRPDGDYLLDEPYQPLELFYDAATDQTYEVRYENDHECS